MKKMVVCLTKNFIVYMPSSKGLRVGNSTYTKAWLIEQCDKEGSHFMHLEVEYGAVLCIEFV